MNKCIKSSIIFSIIGILLVSMSLCCCLPNIAEAKEVNAVPACHQTAKESTPQDSGDCDCAQLISLKINKTNPPIVQSKLFDFSEEIILSPPFSFDFSWEEVQSNNESPPQVAYLKQPSLYLTNAQFLL